MPAADGKMRHVDFKRNKLSDCKNLTECLKVRLNSEGYEPTTDCSQLKLAESCDSVTFCYQLKLEERCGW